MHAGLLEVEHIANKSNFPTYSTDWKNFLLSCGPCNNRKSNTPDRSTVQNWLGHDINNEPEAFDEIRDNHYVWPDIDASPMSHFTFQLEADPGSGWTVVEDEDARDLSNRILAIDYCKKAVKADVRSVGSADVRVLVKDADNEGQELIDLCELNSPGSIGSAYDRRVMNRTITWFEILKSIDGLQKLTTPSAFDAMWSVVGHFAAQTGFFSLWLTLLDGHQDASSNPLKDRFINEFVVPATGISMFPGTDPSRLP